MSAEREGEPRFLVLEYVTITRDPHSGLVVAIGGTERAEGILQTAGGFVSSPGPRGPYHRLPHSLPVDQQRAGATAAAHALLLAGISVHLDPSLNTLTAPDGDRQAAQRYLDQLTERAYAAADDREVASVLTEIAAPHEGLLPRLVQTLIGTWATWIQRAETAGEDPALAEQLMNTTSTLSNHSWQIQQIRDQAARAHPSAQTTAQRAPAAAPAPPAAAPSAKRPATRGL
ncbi:hypothetical protein [Streptomyces sp. NPDC093589]|uniref:hypothetical protein n=1 Tax=Streptomyces sp. NPDC093589 TaxID=3366043 RepID=UPI0037F2C563